MRSIPYSLLFVPLFLAKVATSASPPYPATAPLHEIIPVLYNAAVEVYAGEEKAALEAALKTALAAINEHGVEARRVNEVGNVVEGFVLTALREAGFAADRPTARSGRQRAAGYPDLEASRQGHAFYFEIKTYHPRTETSSQRTFYLSPSEDPKVTHPAFHLAIAFAMEPVGENHYVARSVKLVDLYDLPVKLKIEYNASNRDLYKKTAGTLLLEIPAEKN
jgi:hypothetical protein